MTAMIPAQNPTLANPGVIRPPLQPGQRMPNFALPNAQGMIERFYDRFVGNLVVLVFLPVATGQDARHALDAFAARREAFAAAGAAVVAVGRGPIAALSGAAAKLGLPLYADLEGAISQGLGALGREGESAGLCYLLDRNQRVLASFAAAGQAERVLDYLRDCVAPPSAGRLVAAQAPVLLVPNLFDRELCERAMAAWQAHNSEGTVSIPQRAYAETAECKPSGAIYASLKKRLDHVVDDELNPILMRTAMSRLKPELRKAHQFRAGGLERFCIGAYSAERADFFRPHRDNVTENTKHRRFAVSLALNDDFEGGGVRFAEFSQDVYNPPAGGALVFSCSLLHEAVPVTRGTRFAAFTFLFEAGDLPPGTAT